MNEQETSEDIIVEMRFHGQQNIDAEKDKPEYGILTAEGRIAQNYADRLEAAHKREIDVLKQRCAELNAEVAAKDEVIKRLNDAIAEEQRRKMATAENSSAVGDAAAMHSCLLKILAEMIDLGGIERGKKACFSPDAIAEEIRQALAVPPRNCDEYTANELKVKFNSELVSELPIANEHEKNLVTIAAMGVIDTLFATTQEGGAK